MKTGKGTVRFLTIYTAIGSMPAAVLLLLYLVRCPTEFPLYILVYTIHAGWITFALFGMPIFFADAIIKVINIGWAIILMKRRTLSRKLGAGIIVVNILYFIGVAMSRAIQRYN